MKVGVVGCGFVGATAAYAMVMDGVGRQIVLVDLDRQRAEAEANDIMHAVPFSHPMSVVSGEYSDLAGCRVVVIAAGVSQKPGETRLQLLERNTAVFEKVVPQIAQHAPQAILLVATNPVDVMTHVTVKLAGRCGIDKSRVLGSGTTLDTARFRTLLGRQCGIDAKHVHAYVIGEHGDSEVLTWSCATVGGMRLNEFQKYRDIHIGVAEKTEIDQKVRGAAYEIISGKGATYYGIGAALSRIVDVLIHDQRAILTISARLHDVLGLSDVTISLPTLVGGQGVISAVPISLNNEETAAFHASAAIVREATESLNL
ncbi:L-lactate dehydrogenase [Symmachiella dynata]|uniref:L-lactate dehydrogenase n=1 Tax=Symmachiella dynata TaxID=2527995 RepID=UPI0030EF24B0